MSDEPARPIPGWRLALYTAIMLAPLVGLTLFFVEAGRRIATMRRVTVAEATDCLYRLPKRQPAPFPIATVDGKHGFWHDSTFISLDVAGPGEKLIYVFGGSSVILPQMQVAFPAVLQRKLERAHPGRFHVVNLGLVGYTTTAILAQATAALAVRKPDLLVFYEGHNDSWQAYHMAVQPRFNLFAEGTPLEHLVAGIMIPFYRLFPPRDTRAPPDRAFGSFRDRVLGPAVFRLLRVTGLLRVDPRLVAEVDRITTENFAAILGQMLRVARDAGVPVLIITPVSNLEVPPIGVDGEAERLFREGMAQSDLARRTDLLSRARDRDAFNGFIRAKGPIGDWERGLRVPGVRVLDLEGELRGWGLRFGYESFDDEVHLKPPVHALVADYLYWFMNRERVCCGLDDPVQKPRPGVPSADGPSR